MYHNVGDKIKAFSIILMIIVICGWLIFAGAIFSDEIETPHPILSSLTETVKDKSNDWIGYIALFAAVLTIPMSWFPFGFGIIVEEAERRQTSYVSADETRKTEVDSQREN